MCAGKHSVIEMGFWPSTSEDLKGHLVALLANNVYLIFACSKHKVRNTHAIIVEGFRATGLGRASDEVFMHVRGNRLLILNREHCLVHQFAKDIVYEVYRD